MRIPFETDNDRRVFICYFCVYFVELWHQQLYLSASKLLLAVYWAILKSRHNMFL